MDATAVIDQIQARLQAVAAARPFRFRATWRADAEAHLARLSTLEGYTEAEIAQAEAVYQRPFPKVFRTYLARMGRRHMDLFRGTDLIRPQSFAEEKQYLVEDRADMGFSPLPQDAVIFLSHQGYAYNFTVAGGATDAPVWAFTESQEDIVEAAPSFAAFLSDTVDLIEEVNARQLEGGGYFLTVVGPNGGLREIHPARSERPRPLETDDQFFD